MQRDPRTARQFPSVCSDEAKFGIETIPKSRADDEWERFILLDNHPRRGAAIQAEARGARGFGDFVRHRMRHGKPRGHEKATQYFRAIKVEPY